MANKRISQLPFVGNTGYTATDIMPIVNYLDVTSGTTKQTLLTDLKDYIISGLTGTSLYGGYQYYTAVTVTSSQILTLNTSPVEILPTLTGDKYYDLKVYFEYTYVTTPYTLASPQPIRLINTSGNTLTVFSSIDSISENFCVVANQNDGGALSLLGSINSNVRLFQAGGSDPIGGDGSIKLKVYYNIVSFG